MKVAQPNCSSRHCLEVAEHYQEWARIVQVMEEAAVGQVAQVEARAAA